MTGAIRPAAQQRPDLALQRRAAIPAFASTEGAAAAWTP